METLSKMQTFGQPPEGGKDMSHSVIQGEGAQKGEKAAAKAMRWEHVGCIPGTRGSQCGCF